MNNLPNEIINKILLFNSHPLVDVFKKDFPCFQCNKDTDTEDYNQWFNIDYFRHLRKKLYLIRHKDAKICIICKLYTCCSCEDSE